MTLTVLLLLTTLLPLAARERTDTVYTFRFPAADDMFYLPWRDNAAELARLEACVEAHRGRILAGEIPVLVDGHCTSQATAADNLAVARTRSNRVKSALIARRGLTEDCFTTRNHATGGNFVTVRIALPAPDDKEEENKAEDEQSRPSSAETAPEQPQEQPAPSATRHAADRAETAPEQPQEQPTAAPEEAPQSPRLAAPEQPEVQPVPTASAAPEQAASDRAGLSLPVSLRFNLLHWATLTPDVGIEWRVAPAVGILVNAAYTSWSWSDKNRRYALWEIAPEVRCYVGRARRGYLGAMYKAGSFNRKLSATGRQGDFMGGGITGGYRLRLNAALALDFGLGLGCLHTDYDDYEVADGRRVRSGHGSHYRWGLLDAAVTLTFSLTKH